MSAKGIADGFVQSAANDLRARYGLDDDDVRVLGSRLAEPAGARGAENLESAKRFTEEHRETFDRLAE